MSKIALVIKPGQDWNLPLPGNSQFVMAHLNPATLSTNYSGIYNSKTSYGRPIPIRNYEKGSDYQISFDLIFDDFSDDMPPEFVTGLGRVNRMSAADSIQWLQTICLPNAGTLLDAGIAIEPPLILFVWGSRPVIEVDLELGEIIEELVDERTKMPLKAHVAVTLTRNLPVWL